MKKALFAALSAVFAGCTTIHTADDYHGTGIADGEKPIETVEIENTAWLLLKCIPLGSGDPNFPNEFGCKMFSNTVTLQNNLNMLEKEMERVGATRIANLASRKTDESIFIILLTRRAYHTSAVLLK